MAGNPSQKQTSTEIADHVGTNPVVVRRVLGHLKKAGLLQAEKGHLGGWRLARPPEEISLADIYLALEERLIAPKDQDDPASCSIEHAIETRVKDLLDEIEQSFVTRLGETTISEIRESIGAQSSTEFRPLS